MGVPERSNKRFALGERVVLVKDRADNKRLYIGAVGMVCDTDMQSNIGIAWDDDVGGHSCCGKCKRGHGWYVIRSEIELYNTDDDINEDDIASNNDILMLIGCR